MKKLLLILAIISTCSVFGQVNRPPVIADSLMSGSDIDVNMATVRDTLKFNSTRAVTGLTQYFYSNGLFNLNVLVNGILFADTISAMLVDEINITDDVKIDSTLTVEDSLKIDNIYPNATTTINLNGNVNVSNIFSTDSTVFLNGNNYIGSNTSDTAIISGFTRVDGRADFIDSVTVAESIVITESATVGDTLKTSLISPDAGTSTTFTNDLYVSGLFSADSTAFLNGNNYIGSNASDSAIVSGYMSVGGNSLFSDMASFSDTAKVNTIAPYSGNTTEITNNILLNDTIFFSNDTIVDLLDMTDLTGNIANSSVPLDTVFSDVFIGTIGSSTSCNNVYADTIYGCSPIVLSADKTVVTDTLQIGADADSLYIYTDAGDLKIIHAAGSDEIITLASNSVELSTGLTSFNVTESNRASTFYSALVIPSGTITNKDATPDVSGRATWTYTGSPSVSNDTITNLENAMVDAEYTIIGSSDTYQVVIEDSSIFKMAGNVTFNLGLHDVIRFRCVSVSPNLFIEISRSDN